MSSGANLVMTMSTITSVSMNEPGAVPVVSPSYGSSQASQRAGASAVQPTDAATRQGSSDSRDVLRQSEAIEQLRSSLSENARTRLQIERDEERNGRFVYKLVNPETGEVLRRWPPEKFGDLINFLKQEGAGSLNERA